MAAEPSSKAELDNLRSIVDRCFSDIHVAGLSHEQRFIVAYDAARTLALMIVRAEGYRPKKFGGHYNTFAGLEAADTAAFKTTAAYLQICRMKRNDSEYAMAGGVTSAETDELVKFVTQLAVEVEAWISSHHPGLSM
ncbi:MAG TPA: hypothetical protein VFC46_05460 [Humisphaera sp.]|nr:hypothetical protein [Humisphaera sp.]